VTARGLTLEIRNIVGLFPELLGVGGIQEAGRLTAAALDEIARSRGWVTHFLSLNDPLGSHSLDLDGQTITLQGFDRAKVMFALTGILRARCRSRAGASIVFAAHPNLALPALWMRWILPQLRTVVMSHGIEVWKPLPLLRRWALTGAHLVLGPSTDTAEKLVDVQGVDRDKVRMLAWPISPAFLGMVGAAASLPLPAAFPKGQVVLTVGRWAASERYKGTDELIRAIAQLRKTFPSLHLVAVGGGNDLQRLRQVAVDLGVDDCVHFLTGLSREEVAACYARADVFALPSTGEGFGLVFLEAMAFAKPVVGVALGGTTDVVENRINGLLVPPHDTEALAKALGTLIDDNSLRVELGRRGANMVRQRYQLDLFRHEVEKVIDNALRD
jgi:phosphatidyl-myo-inositol dimannoside synthase